MDISDSDRRMVLDMPVRINEFGPDDRLHGHAWFNYMQHIAAAHAEKIGFGMTALKEKGMAWILSRVKMHLDDSPYHDDILRVETYPNGVDRLFAKRQFKFSSAVTGKVFGLASSYWLVLALPEMRLRPPMAMGVDPELNRELEDFFPGLDRLESRETVNPVIHEIPASHIDLNNHLNNTHYCEYALNWISRQTGKIARISDIQLNYNHAVVLGGRLEVCGHLENDNFYVEGRDLESGKNSFQAEGIFC